MMVRREIAEPRRETGARRPADPIHVNVVERIRNIFEGVDE